MSIQSSVNALIGSIGVIRRANDLATMRKAELSLNQQKVALAEQRAKTAQLAEKRKSDPVYLQTQLKKQESILQGKRNERYAMTLESRKIKKEKEDENRTTKAL